MSDKKRMHQIHLLLLPLSLIATLGLPVCFVRDTASIMVFPGRYILPVTSAISFLLLLALAEMIPERFNKALTIGVAGFMLALALTFFYIMPALTRPPALSGEEIRDLKHRLFVNYGGWVELLGYELDEGRIKAGEDLEVALFWRALKPIWPDYLIRVNVLGPDYQVLGKTEASHRRGDRRISRWRVGDIVRDLCSIPITPHVRTPTFGQISVEFCFEPAFECLPAYDAQGRKLGRSVIFGRFKIAGREEARYSIPNPTSYNLDEKVILAGYDLSKSTAKREESLQLSLYWQAQSRMEKDYTVFVHVVDDNGHIWAQQDNQPQGGNYPTSLLDPGEIIQDNYIIYLPQEMPAGEYRILVGMYLLQTLERLPVFDEARNPLPNNAIPLGKIHVARPDAGSQ